MKPLLVLAGNQTEYLRWAREYRDEIEQKGFAPRYLPTNGINHLGYRDCFYTSYTYKLPEGISKIKTEIEFWYGRKETFPCKFAKKLMKQLPNMKVRVFEGYGHGEILKNTEQLVIELDKFYSN